MKKRKKIKIVNSLDHYVETEDFTKNSIQLSTVKKLFRDLKEEKNSFLLGFLFVIFGTLLTLSEPKLLGEVIDQVILPKKFEWLKWAACLYLSIIFFRICCVSLQGYLFEKMSQNMMHKLRIKLFQRIHGLPLKIFDSTPIGRLITRLTNDTGAMNEMFSSGFILLIGNFLFIIGTIFVLFRLNWKLALIGLSPFPLLILFSVEFSRILITLYRETRMRMSSINSFLAENILGMKVVQLFSVEEDHLKLFRETNEAHYVSREESIKVYSYFQPLITWCSGVSAALLLYFGSKKIISHEMTPGLLVSFLGYCIALFNPIREFVDRWTVFLSGLSSAERIYDLLEWENEKKFQIDPKESVHDVSVDWEIEFKDVTFSYSDESQPVLKHFNFKMKKSEKIGVVGHTGAGKSTLIALMLRYYHPQKGEILLNGKNIQSIDYHELRKYFGLIQQDVFLFSGTLLENISFWKNKDQQAPALIEKLKSDLMHFNIDKKLEFQLEERGSNLSQGEKQIISYLRALYQQPEFYLLDEPTANIDSQTESIILKSLLKEVSNDKKSLLMIAHRLSTVKNCDRIIVLHKGVLMEEGSHQELLQQKGLYYHLAQLDSEVSLVDVTG